MPKIHCKHCSRTFTHDKGTFPKLYFKHLKAEHPRASKKPKHRGGHPGPKHRSKATDGAAGAKIHGFSVTQLYAMLAMIQALIRQSKKRKRPKRSKGKHK